MLRCCLLLPLVIVSVIVCAQKLECEAEILFQSRHIWRGEKLGTASAIEPSVTLSSGMFSFNIWASATLDNSYSEIDLIPSCQFNHFSITLLDYYNPVSGERNQYLNFQEDNNRHSLELNIDNYSIDEQRFKWMIGTFLAGDKNDDTGKPYYSTYLEFKYPFTVFCIDAEPFAGLTPFRGFYADEFALVNTGITFSKELDFQLPFKVPVSLSFITNPYTTKSFVTFGAGIAF